MRTTLSLPDDVAARISSRAERGHRGGNLADAARAELAVFDSLLRAELRRVRLTRAEAQALAEITAGAAFEPHAVGALLFAEVSDAFRLARADDPTGGEVSSYAAQFGIDEDILLRKLLAGGPTVDLALRDALSRWWELLNTDSERAAAGGFREVGLSITDRD